MTQINFDNFEKALKSLSIALQQPPANDLERDGIIQRFEYTFELAWKTAKKVLEMNGITSLSPKSVIRDLAQQQWIDDASLWMEFLHARNLISHIYNEKVANEIMASVKRFLSECSKLISTLKANA